MARTPHDALLGSQSALDLAQALGDIGWRLAASSGRVAAASPDATSIATDTAIVQAPPVLPARPVPAPIAPVVEPVTAVRERETVAEAPARSRILVPARVAAPPEPAEVPAEAPAREVATAAGHGPADDEPPRMPKAGRPSVLQRWAGRALADAVEPVVHDLDRRLIAAVRDREHAGPVQCLPDLVARTEASHDRLGAIDRKADALAQSLAQVAAIQARSVQAESARDARFDAVMARLDAIATGQSELASRIGSLEGAVGHLAAALGGRLDDLSERQSVAAAGFAALEQRLGAGLGDVDAGLAGLRDRIGAVDDEVAGRLAALEPQLDARIVRVEAAVAAVEATIVARLEQERGVLLAQVGQRFGALDDRAEHLARAGATTQERLRWLVEEQRASARSVRAGLERIRSELCADAAPGETTARPLRAVVESIGETAREAAGKAAMAASASAASEAVLARHARQMQDAADGLLEEIAHGRHEVGERIEDARRTAEQAHLEVHRLGELQRVSQAQLDGMEAACLERIDRLHDAIESRRDVLGRDAVPALLGAGAQNAGETAMVDLVQAVRQTRESLEGLSRAAIETPRRLEALTQSVNGVAARHWLPLDQGRLLALRNPYGYLCVPSGDRDQVMFLGQGEPPEPGTLALLDDLLQPGDVFVDVGANLGLFTVAAARRVGGGGRVIAIEPTPDTVAALAQTIRINGLEPIVELHAVAAGAHEGEATLYLGATSAHNSLVRLSDGAACVNVPVRTLDALIGDRQVKLVKIDVEGAELSVLDGLGEVLRRQPDLLVVAELGGPHLARSGTTLEAWLQSIADRGLELLRIDDRPVGLAPLRATDRTADLAINVLIGRKLTERFASRLQDGS